ncbi:MAG: winged helix-turn-helix domain-containing protein, partial [Actinomycetota bacterium]|nr:winged helix-turn-helix domain-containing protein [Actinomycetota bacterium]
LVLDPATSKVWRDGEPIELTPREVALLAFLMRNEGRIRSKHDILQQVWGADFDRDPNVVEVYVGYLRRKIDQPFGIRTLHTVRGQGYQLQSGG